jgi:hypothetical protein
MKNNKIIIISTVVISILLVYLFYDKFFGSPRVRVINSSNESISVVIGYPGGKIEISDIYPNKVKTIRLRNIKQEGSISVEVNGKFIDKTGYVGPYPSKTDVIIVKRKNEFYLEQKR